MPNGLSHPSSDTLNTPAGITQDLVSKHQTTGKTFRLAVLAFGALFALGIVGFALRLTEGVDNKMLWGYHAAAFAFILATAQAAPMVAIAPRLVKAHWRRPISRTAELFTVVGLFNILLFIPLLWVLPSLNDGRRSLWFFGNTQNVPEYMPQIATSLALVSLVLTGLALLWVSSLPDLATVRDNSEGKKLRILTFLARGWMGTSRQWHMLHHRLGILGAFYFMMLVFVHFLVSVDFAMALVPGWIDSLFPITQAHNALQAGVATVLITMFLLRKFGGYEDYITLDQFWGLGKILFALSLLWFWFWFSSFNIFWYGAKPSERYVLELLMFGPYKTIFVGAFLCLFVIPLFTMIWNPLRKSIWGPTLLATVVLIGAFLDKIRIYVASYSVEGIGDASVDKHELHSVHATVLPGLPDLLIWIGAISGSILVYMLASKIFPPVNIWEQKELLLYKVHKPFHRTEVLVLGKPE